MSEPNLNEHRAVLAVVPSDRRVQRFQLVQRAGVVQQPNGPQVAYLWLSHHRSQEAAQRALDALLPGDRVEARIFDLKRAEFCETAEWSRDRGRALGDVLSRHLASGGSK
jgi:hypothetical protein